MIRNFAFIIFIAATAFAATGPIDVNPTFGAPAGGDLVGINFQNGAKNECAVTLACTPSATFDGVPTTIFRSLPDALIVRSPAHARGDVKLSIFVGATYQASFHYLAEEDWERVLMPINIRSEVPGAAGSRWVTNAQIANTGDEAVDAKWGLCGSLIDPPCPPFVHLPAGGKTIPLLPDPAFAINTPGVFIYVPKYALSQVFANARVRDLSRQAEAAGTELPFVRVDDFQTSAMLLGVPNDTRFRSTLRIYGAASAPMRARIRIWALDADGEPLIDVMRDLAGFVTLLPISFPQEPAYAEIPLEPFGLLGRGSSLRIQVSADQPLWAFVSTTNNATQQVTLVTPQLSRK